MSLPFRAWVVEREKNYNEVKKQRDELLIQLQRSSHNSHLPPSRDRSAAKDQTNRKKRGAGKRRRPGGQKGHPGHRRPLVPPERVDARVEHFPQRCRGCGRDLCGHRPDPEPLRHQIAEIPAITPTVIEHVRHRITCCDCHTTSTAQLPDDVPTACFGPNLRSLVVLLSGRFRLSRRETAELCRDVFGVSVSVGCIATILTRVGGALAAPYDEIARQVPSSSVAYMDETGWREKGKALHLWILVAPFAVLFRIGRRTKGVAQDLLGKDYQGHVVTDRYAGYLWLADERHQVCWAHLDRNFEDLVERGGAAKKIGKACQKVTEDLFAIWHAYKDSRIRWETMQRRMVAVECRMGELLERGSGSRNAAAKRLCESLRGIESSLFVFARVQGVEPTNNTGERGIRPAVQWRKTCFGTQSRGGSRFVERILTVVATCRQQQRPLLAYLRTVIVAMDAGREIPSLIMGSAADLRTHGLSPPPAETALEQTG
jgi:transposase